MKLNEIYSSQNHLKKTYAGEIFPIISFEVFPPKNGNNDQLIDELLVLKNYFPSIISVTHGAGGSFNSNNLELAKHIKEKVEIDVMPHFTCINSSKNNIEKYIQQVNDFGFENILALRGDIKEGIKAEFFDFNYANELVQYIKINHNLSIGVAGYPEKHNVASSLEIDIENLKRKVDCGADVIYTQLFFNNEHFYKFKHFVREAGINIPIVAGILPIVSFSQLEKMVKMCQVELPKALYEKLEKYKNDNSIIKQIGIDFASIQCNELINAGVEGLHFYTLNRAFSTQMILENLL